MVLLSTILFFRSIVLKCKPASQRSTSHFVVDRQITSLKCMRTGTFNRFITEESELYSITLLALPPSCPLSCRFTKYCLLFLIVSYCSYCLHFVHSIVSTVVPDTFICTDRLQNPFECPFNGSRRQDCQCRNDYPAAGYTLFSRVRLDISSMRIISESLRSRILATHR